ncbi:nuclear pore complex protein Nup153-like isoform X2 [Thunnus thynnus]|uniref:nuclear pore complex protein Nup153-like isoform X2 n=1 Tax=Thunnus thynnus TaxID=8237 RepID=UPI003528D2EA
MSQPTQAAAAPSNSVLLIPPDKFDFNNANEWPKWIRRFERFRVASSLDKKTQECQVNTLMYTLGDEAEDILNVLPLNENQRKSYEDVKQAFGKHCANKRNIIFERARFNGRNQEPGESAEAFITAVHRLAEHCAFGDVREDLIRDRIVVGLRDIKLSESLQLDPELTLVKTIATVCHSEEIKKQQPIHGSINEMQSEAQRGTKGETYSSQVKPENKNRATDCGRCGNATENQRKDCPVKDSECHKCKQKGHFAQKCRPAGGTTADSADYKDEEDVAFFGEAGFTLTPLTKSGKSTEDFEGPFKPAKTLKQGSMLDLLKAPGFASPVARTSPSPHDAPQQTSTSFTVPSTTSTLSSSTGFGDLFKAPAGYSCDVCLVQNKSSDTKCVCCMNPQPSSSSSKSRDSKPTATSVGQESSSTNSTSTTGFGTIFSKPAGTWDCDTCLVLNKPDAVKCVACKTAKPGTGLKPSLTLPSAFSAVKTVSNPTAPITTGFIGFGDKSKKPEGAWECDICLVQNKAEDTKCVACMSAKPGASAEPSDGATSSDSSAPVFGLGDKFKKEEGSWDCDICLVLNKPDEVKCVACETAKPGTGLKPSLSNPTAPITTGFIGFGDKFKKPEGAWECHTCMIQNKAEDTKCVCCMSAKDSTAPVFGLGDKFKKEEGSWDCDVCLLQNKAADVQCVACHAAKPGAKVEPKGGEFQFGGSSRVRPSNNSSGVLTFRTDPSIAPQAGTPGGGFNFPQPHTFLIGSTKSFTASPARQQTIAGHKIKTAVRRRK